ncbi:DUF3533 domain-containing protein, partial [Streptomyces albogriseolus]
MTQSTGPGTRPRPFLGEVRDAVTPRATLLVLGVIALMLLFITSYVGALHHPQLRDAPVGVVAPPSAARETVTRLKELPGSPLDPRAVDGADTARRQIEARDIDGALVVDPEGTTDTLLVATGGGTALATALERLFTEVERDERRTLRVEDVAPASAQDANGLSSFYVVVGWCVGGDMWACHRGILAGAPGAHPRRGV